MAGQQIKGKAINAVVNDISDGFLFLNAVVLKKYDIETYKALYRGLKKTQKTVRSEPFPAHDTLKIRKRNIRLQRLHTAIMILEHSAKTKRMSIF